MSLLDRASLDEVMHADMEERLVVTPLLDEDQVGAASIDLRLGINFLFLRRTHQAGLDPMRIGSETNQLHEKVLVPLGKSLWLHPQQFVLGSTLEFIRMPRNLSALLIGRSSWARLGLVVETAGMVQPGFSGSLTYELVNTGDSPIRLYSGLRIAQLAVYTLEKSPEEATTSSGKYDASIGPQASRLAWEDSEIKKLERLGARRSSAGDSNSKDVAEGPAE